MPSRAPGMTHEELSWFVDDTVIRALQGVKGVPQIDRRIGGAEREIRIALDPDRLLAFGITAGDVNRQLQSDQRRPGRRQREIGGREQAIRTLAGKQTVEDLAATMITLPSGRRSASTELGTRHRRHRRAAHLRRPATARRSSPSPSPRPRARATSTVAADVAPQGRRAADGHIRTSSCKLIDSMVDYTLGAYRLDA